MSKLGVLFSKFKNFVTYDKEGHWNGVRENAPLEAKKAYEEYRKKQDEAKKRGWKI